MTWRGKRDVADFVEKQGAALRLLDFARGGLDRAGEGAAFVAEQFGFEQGFGNRGAVDRDEFATCPRAVVVDRAGEQFLAGAACTEQHYRDVGAGDAFDGSGDLEHFGGAGDDRAEQGRSRAAG